MPVFTTLPSLLALYRIDNELHDFQSRLTGVLKDQRELEASIKKLGADLAELESAGRKIQATISSYELDLKARQEHIDKMRTSLNTTKTNKEYSAILVQISAEKEEISKLEGVVLDLMGQLETNGKSASGVRDQLTAIQANLVESQKRSAQQVSELQSRIKSLELARGQAAARVPKDALTQYERVGKRYPGHAMAPVEFDENNLEDISCGGCFMSLSTEDVNLLRGRDELRRCQSCGRILYLPEMLPQDASHAS
ncbi:MAG TPA: C4-type zinc ribbon domain-containing protein [Phycisphaerae bacterium]|nr:C4-type zinc ribbon domain-containing protein [Phycisphaerae bacterium]